MIDGVLDDEVWAMAAHLSEFTQQAPLDGAPATEATDVYIAYDSETLYLAFHAHYQDPAIMRANRVERDRAMQDDLMTIYFDTFMDQQRGYDFDVNGYGVRYRRGLREATRHSTGRRQPGIPVLARELDRQLGPFGFLRAELRLRRNVARRESRDSG